MLNRKLKINYRVLVIIFLIFPMLKFDEKAVEVWLGSQVSSLAENILVAWNLISLAAITILFVNKVVRHGVKFVKIYTWLSLALFFVFTVSTLMMSDNVGIYNIIREIGNIPAVFMLANIFSDENYKEFLQGFYYDLTIIMFLAAVIIYLLPPAYTNNNESAYYLYGLDNISFLYSMNGFFAGMLYHLSQYGKLSRPFLAIYLFIGGAYVYSGTGTGTVIVLLCILFVFLYKNQLLDLLNYRIVLIVCAVLFVFLAFIQELSIFSALFHLIGKDVTMSGRSLLWAAAFREFPKHPIIGIGISSTLLGNILYAAGVNWGTGIGHLHNVVIEYMFRGGIVNLAVYIFLWLCCYKTVQKIEKNRLRNSIFCMLLMQFLAYMFEYRFADISYWILLLSLYNLPHLSGDFEKAVSEADELQEKKPLKLLFWK